MLNYTAVWDGSLYSAMWPTTYKYMRLVCLKCDVTYYKGYYEYKIEFCIVWCHLPEEHQNHSLNGLVPLIWGLNEDTKQFDDVFQVTGECLLQIPNPEWYICGYRLLFPKRDLFKNYNLKEDCARYDGFEVRRFHICFVEYHKFEGIITVLLLCIP